MAVTVISYNVNGIRSAIGKGLIDWIEEMRPDVFCVQEIKAQIDQIDILPFERLGYKVYFHSAMKKGYSGVAIFSLNQPLKVQLGIGITKYDQEGRFILADYENFSVLNVYCPSGTMGEDRQNFKMEFLSDFGIYIRELRKQRKKLLVCGDFNICHHPIDINYPERHLKSSGFLPGERKWMDELVKSGLSDSFRHFHSEGQRYSWWSYRSGARVKNLGWRIDYHFVTPELSLMLSDSDILSEVKHADHCPVIVKFEDLN